MRLSSLSFLGLGFVVLGCTSRMEVVPLGPPGQKFDPVPPESVYFFDSQDRVRVKYQPVARIYVGFNFTTSGMEGEEQVLEALREKAAEVGAHGVVLGTEAEVPEDVKWGGYPAGAATAIRFVDPSRAEGPAAVRFPSECRTILIAPLAVPEDIAVPDSIVAGFGRDIYDQLVAAGFAPLPLETWDSAWARVAGEAGVAEDPSLAIKNQDAAFGLEERVLQMMEEEYGADGFLFPDMVGAQARFDGDEARWDGIRQKVGETRSTGAKIASWFLNAFIGGGGGEGEEGDTDPSGSVNALSLEIRIENAIGARVFTGRGGIELIEGADFEGGIYIGDPEPEEYEVVEIPDVALFQKRSRLERAVRIALGPLLAGRGGP